MTLLSGQAGLQLRGDADISTIDALERAIAVLPPDAGEIHLQMIALDFMDVRAVRELLTLTRRPPAPLLILHYPPIVLPRVIQLLWPETFSQIRIHAIRGTGLSQAAVPVGQSAWPSGTGGAPECRGTARRHPAQRLVLGTLRHAGGRGQRDEAPG